MPQKLPTIIDVAKRAKVSVGTVSNVLNGTIRVSEIKRDRVLKAITELGYTQNMLAQGLRRRRSPIIGLCVPFTSITYFAALVDAFEEVASDRGFEIMQVVSGQDPAKELQRIRSLLKYHVGGIMLVPSAEPEAAVAAIAQAGIPLVVVDRPSPDPGLDQVTFDNYGAMFEATARLIALGHHRILFLVRQRRLSVTVKRIEALQAAISQAVSQVTLDIIECSYEETVFLARLKDELASDRRPTAIIVSNSELAAWTFRALRRFGIACPDDISLLAFDEPEWADLVQPSLSVICQPTRAIALTAWDFMMRRMKGEVDDPQRVELKAEIIMRDSVGPARRKTHRRRRTPAAVAR